MNNRYIIIYTQQNPKKVDATKSQKVPTINSSESCSDTVQIEEIFVHANTFIAYIIKNLTVSSRLLCRTDIF